MSADSSSAELAGREAAHAAILGVLTRQMFVSETLGRLRDEMRLSGREAGLATEIALGAVRHIHTLETILSAVARYEPTRVQPPVRAICLRVLTRRSGWTVYRSSPRSTSRSLWCGS